MIWEVGASTISALLEGVQLWRNRKEQTEKERANKHNAIGKVMTAAVATKAYLFDARELANPSRHRERELSHAWQEAANAISSYDMNLFDSSQVKSLGWADPREWERLKDKAVTINIDEIIKQCEWLQKETK